MKGYWALAVVVCSGCGLPKGFVIEERTDLGPMANVTVVTGQTPEEFLRTYAKRGCIGLIGKTDWLARGIRGGQEPITLDPCPSLWSHAWLFEGEREDAEHWIQESTIQFRLCWPQFRNGTQENRLSHYFEPPARGQYLAVIDWRLNEQQQKAVLAEGLRLIAAQEPYPVIGLFGTLCVYVFRPRDIKKWMPDGYYCSAFVQKAYEEGAGIDLASDLPPELTSPEHLWLGSLRAGAQCNVWLLNNDDD